MSIGDRTGTWVEPASRGEGSSGQPRPAGWILGMRVDAVSGPEAVRIIGAWARDRQSRFVAVANAHNAILGHDHPAFRRVMNSADLVTADGMPLVWGLGLLGAPRTSRIRGTTLLLEVCRMAEADGLPVGFYGSTDEVLQRLRSRLLQAFPSLPIAYLHGPPFRPLSPAEDELTVREIVDSGSAILFVGLGAPKQEEWIAAHRGRIPAVMIGAGAAFDFVAGTKREAPVWMQEAGLEWLFRLASEPRRLWRRYVLGNPRFLWHFGRQVLGSARGRRTARSR
jgi:N-acetylglucosaminyldiphosphoundecaprenol N-acetyl-beta-D-mannosaminyltransferase